MGVAPSPPRIAHHASARAPTTDHPRPLLQRPWRSLDGDWEFALDRERRVDHPTDVDFDASIVVPFAPETPASGITADGYVQRCWYRLTVPVAPPTGDERVIVHFGGGCWTQLTDTYQEVNGLLTADRRPKADIDHLAAATRGKPHPE